MHAHTHKYFCGQIIFCSNLNYNVSIEPLEYLQRVSNCFLSSWCWLVLPTNIFLLMWPQASTCKEHDSNDKEGKLAYYHDIASIIVCATTPPTLLNHQNIWARCSGPSDLFQTKTSKGYCRFTYRMWSVYDVCVNIVKQNVLYIPLYSNFWKMSAQWHN